jgi:hypothetical protein
VEPFLKVGITDKNIKEYKNALAKKTKKNRDVNPAMIADSRFGRIFRSQRYDPAKVRMAYRVAKMAYPNFQGRCPIMNPVDAA